MLDQSRPKVPLCLLFCDFVINRYKNLDSYLCKHLVFGHKLTFFQSEALEITGEKGTRKDVKEADGVIQA